MPFNQHAHYLPDSPTSQYRNRKIFTMVLNHKELFGVSADWLYFEIGHGKGPADGVGGISKRNADLTVKRNVKICNASEYCSWGNSAGKVTYLHVSSDEVSEGVTYIESRAISKPRAGTMTTHCVVVPERGMIGPSTNHESKT